MNSESGQRLSVEELKRLNLPPQSAPMLPAHPTQQECSGAEQHGGDPEIVDGDDHSAGTGWEEERTLYLAARFGYGAVCTGLADLAPAGDAGGHGGLADHLVWLGRILERGQGADPVMDSTTMPHRSDHKTLRREQEKKIALGHKEDDHEEEPTWQQSLG